MFTEIRFKKRITAFKGRNGVMKCSGVEVYRGGDLSTMWLSPLTSRGVVGRCYIEVPVEDIPALIKAIREAQKYGKA